MVEPEINYEARVGEVLAPIVSAVHQRAVRLDLHRLRGGSVRGIWWAELAGRPTAHQGMHAGWVEIRLHYRPIEQRINLGVLVYDPLSQGGRTRVLVEHAAGYTSAPSEVYEQMIVDLERALDQIEHHGLRDRDG